MVKKRGLDSLNFESNSSKKVDLKNVFIRLKDGEGVRVRMLSSADVVPYHAHGDYQNGIYTQPCTLEDTGKCVFCEANRLKEDGWTLYAKQRAVFAFANIDTGEVQVFDATAKQAKVLQETLKEYVEDLDEICFTLKRSGNGNETSYMLNPIFKLKGNDVDKFKQFDGQEVEDEFFDTVLQARTYEQQVEELTKSKFPVDRLGIVPTNASKEEPLPPVGNQPTDDPSKLF